MPDDLTLKALEKMNIAPKVVSMLAQMVLASTGRENLLQQLKSRWTNPQRLKKPHKDHFKIIRSLEQGYDGSEAICIFCKRRMSIGELQVHHPTYIINQNELQQLRVACITCNDADNKKHLATVLGRNRLTDPRQGERALGGVAVVVGGLGSLDDEMNSVPFSSREGMKHAIMRPRYDRWVRDLVNGPFAQQHSWNPRKLAEAAPYGCGESGKALGSSKTYYKYVREDMAGGILIIVDEVESGVFGVNVKLNKELLEKIRQGTGQ